jgi:hypothetical protein
MNEAQIKKLQRKVAAELERKKPKEAEEIEANKDGKLSPEQIQHWRKALCLQLGPYALFMPDEDIQKLRDKMQDFCDNFSVNDHEPV